MTHTYWCLLLPPYDPNAELEIVTSWDDVPRFANECEEAHFWSTHEIGEELWLDVEDDVVPSIRPGPRRLTIEVEGEAFKRLERLARIVRKRYELVLQQLVDECLNDERWEILERFAGQSDSMTAMEW